MTLRRNGANACLGSRKLDRRTLRPDKGRKDKIRSTKQCRQPNPTQSESGPPIEPDRRSGACSC
jgi:hypothetical protein